jgi:hypothetical protein
MFFRQVNFWREMLPLFSFHFLAKFHFTFTVNFSQRSTFQRSTFQRSSVPRSSVPPFSANPNQFGVSIPVCSILK